MHQQTSENNTPWKMEAKYLNVTFKGSCVVGPAMRAALLQTSLSVGGKQQLSRASLSVSVTNPSVWSSLVSSLFHTFFILQAPQCEHLVSWSIPCPHMVFSIWLCVYVCECVCVSELYVCCSDCFSVEVVREMEKDQPLSFKRPIQSCSSKPQQPSPPPRRFLPPLPLPLLSLSSSFICLVNKPRLTGSSWTWLYRGGMLKRATGNPLWGCKTTKLF